MTVIKPEKIGEAEVLAKGYGRSLIHQLFSNPRTGKQDDFILFHINSLPSIVMPVTKTGELICINQFRHGGNNMFIEFPGGNQKSGESPEEVARVELLEETGYLPGRLIRLMERVAFDPSSFTVYYAPFLALECEKVRELQLDETEHMETMLIPLDEWFRMIRKGEIADSKTLAITMLALPYFDIVPKFSKSIAPRSH